MNWTGLDNPAAQTHSPHQQIDPNRRIPRSNLPEFDTWVTATQLPESNKLIDSYNWSSSINTQTHTYIYIHIWIYIYINKYIETKTSMPSKIERFHDVSCKSLDNCLCAQIGAPRSAFIEPVIHQELSATIGTHVRMTSA